MEKVKKGDTIRIIRMNDYGGKDWKTRARVTPRADKALTPDIFYD